MRDSIGNADFESPARMTCYHKLTRDCCAVVAGDAHGNRRIDWRIFELKG